MKTLIENARVVFKDIDCGDRFEVLKTRDGQLTLGGKYSRDLVEFYAKTNDDVVVLGYGEELPEDKPLKVGDYAKVVNDWNNYNLRGILAGTIVEIIKVEEGSDIPYEIKSLVTGATRWAKNDHIETVTEGEVAEAERWAAIGRKPGEFKVGDIVRALGESLYDYGTIGEVTEVSGDGTFRVEANGRTTANWHALDEVELITPAEARFDRE